MRVVVPGIVFFYRYRGYIQFKPGCAPWHYGIRQTSPAWGSCAPKSTRLLTNCCTRKYDSFTDFGTGQRELCSDKTGVTLDDFVANDANAREALTPHFSGMADTAISGGSLVITGTTRGGEAVLDNFNDDDYMIEANYNPGADFLAVWFRYQDANNSYVLTIGNTSTRRMALQKVVNGKATSLASAVVYSLLDFQKFSIELVGTRITIRHDGNVKFDLTDPTFAAGGVAFSGASPALLDLKVGYDNNRVRGLDHRRRRRRFSWP